jgi:hypothetical protein
MGVIGPAQGGGREREVIMGPEDDDRDYKAESEG